jgi:hypothetical protein
MMRKANGSVPIEKYRHRQNGAMMQAMAQQIGRWVDAHFDKITGVFPIVPEGIDNRDDDLCEPLLQIADAAGGHWPETARAALLAVLRRDVTEEERANDVPITHRLTADMLAVFAEAGNPAHLSTMDLVEGLLTLPNSPWSDLWPNHGAVSRELAALLAPLGVTPVNVRQGAKVLKGYKRAAIRALVAEQTAPQVTADDAAEDGDDLDGEILSA